MLMLTGVSPSQALIVLTAMLRVMTHDTLVKHWSFLGFNQG